jgi:hypothetical protein
VKRCEQVGACEGIHLRAARTGEPQARAVGDLPGVRLADPTAAAIAPNG